MKFQRKITAIEPGKKAFRVSPWEGVVRQASQSAAIEKLTPRCLQIFILFGRGNEPREIGIILGISGKTVSSTRINILQRMDLDSTYQMMAYCIRADMDKDDFMNRYL